MVLASERIFTIKTVNFYSDCVRLGDLCKETFLTVNSLKHRSDCLYHLLQHSDTLHFATQCIYLFRIVISVPSDYFPTQ